MHDGSSTAPGSVIPGWRVIRSDAGRFWASRVEPFPEETEWYAPPFRTVDGDTFDALRAEVAVQEEAAGRTAAGQGPVGEGEREIQRAALAQAVPRLEDRLRLPLTIPLWFALYREPLSPQQERAGFRPTILRGSAEEFQAELALRSRTRRLPLSPAPRTSTP